MKNTLKKRFEKITRTTGTLVKNHCTLRETKRNLEICKGTKMTPQEIKTSEMIIRRFDSLLEKTLKIDTTDPGFEIKLSLLRREVRHFGMMLKKINKTLHNRRNF